MDLIRCTHAFFLLHAEEGRIYDINMKYMHQYFSHSEIVFLYCLCAVFSFIFSIYIKLICLPYRQAECCLWPEVMIWALFAAFLTPAFYARDLTWNQISRLNHLILHFFVPAQSIASCMKPFLINHSTLLQYVLLLLLQHFVIRYSLKTL